MFGFLPGEADEGMDEGIEDAGSNESIGWKKEEIRLFSVKVLSI